MGSALKLTGKKFGHLVVLGVYKSIKNEIFWRCKCDCGKESVVSGYKLKSGHTKSCGHLKWKWSHGLSHTNLYHIWFNMIERCHNPSHKSYKDYGGRGITVCKLWRNDISSFYYWAIKNKWSKGLYLDRKNNNGKYTPSNCRFVTCKVNANNKRNSVYLTFNNEKLTKSEWATKFDTWPGCIEYRMKKGWNTNKIFTIPFKKRGKRNN